MSNNQIEMINLLISRTARIDLESKIDQNELTRLHKEEKYDQIELLLQTQKDIKSQDYLTTIDNLYKNRCNDVANLLLEKILNISDRSDYEEILKQSHKNGLRRLTFNLIKKGKDRIFEQDENGFSLIHQLYQDQEYDLLKSISKQQKVKLNGLHDDTSYNILLQLTKSKPPQHQLINLFLEHINFDMSQLNSDGISPLHRALLQGHNEMLRILIDSSTNLQSSFQDILQASTDPDINLDSFYLAANLLNECGFRANLIKEEDQKFLEFLCTNNHPEIALRLINSTDDHSKEKASKSFKNIIWDCRKTPSKLN